MFGETLKKLRTQKGLSQENVAAELHVVRQTVSKWEKGLSSPSLEQLVSLSNLFNISPGKFLGLNDEFTNDTQNIERLLSDIRLGTRLAKIKRALVGGTLLICGTIGCSAQRIIDTVFTANNWTIQHSGFNLLLLLSLLSIVIGIILCVFSLKECD